MRTPWRFVADLVSRNPKVDNREDNPAASPEPIALEHQPATAEAHPEIEVKPAEQSIEIAAKEQVDAARPSSDASFEPIQISEDASAPAGDEGSANSADAKDAALIDAPTEIKENVAAQEQTPTADALPKPVAIPELKRRKTARPVLKQSAPLSQVEDNASAVPKSLINEMADLDAEVYALRRQLAEKLSAQNAQLREMLARFDAR
ncbi:hypothetical protein JZX87_25765 [Agrobacterium sp. Ap1]|uniref:hypothetical protein n=1 Tax=Rhizobium/Agrobacterium group TaxID=227290 RepID=UPI001A8CA33F|nr:hypothetical protein [Agrobacterium sp. Ap1]MBO0144565.1 hypothetical protein [Agrobacterium sp. Ap1]